MLSFDRFGASNRKQNSFLSITSDAEKAFVLCVAKLRLLFRLNFKTDSIEKETVYLQYVECAPAVNDVDKKLGFVPLW